jgi:hypothetical protein
MTTQQAATTAAKRHAPVVSRRGAAARAGVASLLASGAGDAVPRAIVRSLLGRKAFWPALVLRGCLLLQNATHKIRRSNFWGSRCCPSATYVA